MSERWMPKNLEIYWSVIDAAPMHFAWQGNPLEIARWEAGNVFKTEDEALIASINIKSLLLSLHDNNLATNLQDKQDKLQDKQDKLQDKPLPKLTAEVFDRPDCPPWAKYAAITPHGSLLFFEKKPIITKNENNFENWNTSERWHYSGSGFLSPSDWQNSLIERPAKKPELPEWCKPGEWVWLDPHKIAGANGYEKVTNVDGFGLMFKSGLMVCFSHRILQARLRPYNAEEMKALVGKVIEFDTFAQLVLMYDGKDNAILAGDGDWISESTLLKDYTINNKPAGVLEHLENGEWVK